MISYNNGLLIGPHVSSASTSPHVSHLVTGPFETVLSKLDIEPS